MDKKSYFDDYDKTLCCGCRACEQACPKNAIEMKHDSEGAIYPLIDKEKCIDCGLCKKVCPISNPVKNGKVNEIYALQNKNEEYLKASSSGGVFAALAEYVLRNNGRVYGCRFDSENKAIICAIERIDEIPLLQGSKYVFSNTENTYSEVKENLDNGVMVLYTGTPCQIAGLKGFLRKDYDKLITMDFLCHGMPSEKFFKENIAYLEKKYNGKISDYKFRDKQLKGWGHVSSFYVNGNKKYEPGKVNAYFNAFISGYISRYNCYSCKFKGSKRASDVTVGDFWGIASNTINTKKGVSFISINTQRGKDTFESIEKDFYTEVSTIDEVSKKNSSILKSDAVEIPEIRNIIYTELDRIGYKSLRKKYLIPNKFRMMKIKGILDEYISKCKGK